jgi:hypothetical protein
MNSAHEFKIISGGQSGVDRAALDAAISCGIPHGGWCPRGRMAEDGVISGCYHLIETDTGEYAKRTERNVLDSDATVIFARVPVLSGGTLLTRELANKHGRPVSIILETAKEQNAVAELLVFVRKNSVRILNVAGPRDSQAPGLGGFVNGVIQHFLSLLNE